MDPKSNYYIPNIIFHMVIKLMTFYFLLLSSNKKYKNITLYTNIPTIYPTNNKPFHFYIFFHKNTHKLVTLF